MALQLEINYKGINANYWRINNLIYDDTIDTMIVSIWLYASRGARVESLENTWFKQDVVMPNISSVLLPEDKSSFITARDLLKTMLYVKIKELPEWSNAVDC